MAKYDDKTRKVTVQKGDNPTKIAAFLRTKLKENVTTKQVQQAIGNRRIFTGTTFTFGKAKTLDGDTGGNKNNSGGGGGSSVGSSVGAAGGSGVVYIKYPTSAATGFTVTATVGTSSTVGSDTLWTFLASGTITVA